MSKVVIIGGGAAGMAAAIGAADMTSPSMKKMKSLEKRSILQEKEDAT